MCLNLINKDAKPQKVTEPITCYKVLRLKDDKLYSYHHTEYQWEIGKVHASHLRKDRLIKTVSRGLHSFKNLFSTIYPIQDTSYPCVAVKCIIPEGAKYYVGKHGDNLEGYASDKLIPIEIITPEEVLSKFYKEYPYKIGQTIKLSSPYLRQVVSSDIDTLIYVSPGIDTLTIDDVHLCEDSVHLFLTSPINEFHIVTDLKGQISPINPKFDILETK